MRRAQSVRNHMARPSLALAADDLGVLREGDESNEDVLRKQLIEKDRECDRLNMTIAALRQQLELRPPVEEIKMLRDEQKSLEVLMQGYQRENEKSMAIIEQYKSREKLLERELNRLAGDNWRSALEIPPSAAILPANMTMSGRGTLGHHRSNTISISSPYSSSSHSQTYSPGSSSWLGENSFSTVTGLNRSRSPSPTMRGHQRREQRQRAGTNATTSSAAAESSAYGGSRPSSSLDTDRAEREEREREDREAREAAQRAALQAQIEQMRVFILGMEKRLDVREEKLSKTLEKAEGESRRYEEAVVAASLKAA